MFQMAMFLNVIIGVMVLTKQCHIRYTLNFAYYGVWQEFNECWCGNAQPEVELDLAECAEKSSKASSIFSMQNRRKLP